MPLLRSIAKSVTWRIIGVFLLGGLAWVFTGDVAESIGITVVFNAIRVVLFVLHEEVWERWTPLAVIGRRHQVGPAEQSVSRAHAGPSAGRFMHPSPERSAGLDGGDTV